VSFGCRKAQFAVMPAGNPLSVTCTSPENPFSAVTLTLTALLVLPCETETVDEEKLMAKSSAGGGVAERKTPRPASNRPIRSPNAAPKRHKHTSIHVFVQLRNTGHHCGKLVSQSKKKAARTFRSRRQRKEILIGS